ncbi:putative uncharacterized protein [Prevotella sp. CAG:487]|nr:putative uncharacterized protein [Prevotella sp. CAG:487]
MTADASVFEGRKLYCALINSTDWSSASLTSVPYGVYSFSIGGDMAMTPLRTAFDYDFTAASFCRDTFVGIAPMSVMGVLNGARYITIDTENWQELKRVMYGTEKKSYSLLSSTMAYNPIDNNTYSLQYNDGMSGMDWCIYNDEYDEMDKIAAFRGKYNVLTLAAVPDGGMFFINWLGDLYRIDRKTARPTLVGTTGVQPVMYSQSMVYDGRTGLFIWAAQTETGSELYAVNPETAETSLIGRFNKNEQIVALKVDENAAKDGAPAMAEGLNLVFDADGSLGGKIEFTVPRLTYGGAALGDAMLNVWLDGENLKGVPAVPGEKVSIPVTLSEGNHYVAVNTSNGTGYSPLASIRKYAGYDTPLPVGDVNFAYDADTGKNTVSWNAPAAGVNGGYLDKANIRYTVVRMPDSVTVADNYAQTVFTETTPEAMHNYSYRVYATNNGKRGEYAESERIICGDAFTAPYSQSFADASVLGEFFTVVDANDDNNTWRTGFNDDVRIDISAYSFPTGDDWLITPAISLDGGVKYRYTINMKTFTNGYPESFEVYVGTDPADLSTFRKVASEEAFELYEDFGDYHADFLTDKPGKYYLALRYTGDSSKNASMLMLKKVSVSAVGAAKAPAAAGSLKVTAGADDAMTATVSFDAPDRNLEEQPVSPLTRISIYRNKEAEPAHVFESPSAGAHLTWTDGSVKSVGMNTYTVVPENEYGAGESAADSAFVGVYTAPYKETFDSRGAADLYTSTLDGIDLEINPFYGWEYDSMNKRMKFSAYVTDTPVEAWLYTPMIRLDADAVYELSLGVMTSVYSETVTNKVYMGTSAEPQTQSVHVGDLPKSTAYQMKDVAYNVVTGEGGKYCFGINSKGTSANDYLDTQLDDVRLTYKKSAFSPYEFTGYKSEAAADGSLKAVMTFRTPAVDYHGNALKENVKVEIFRGQNPAPVYTANDVVPGAAMTWTDTQPLHGQNTYMLVASNSYGRSEVLTDTLFVGRDVPLPVGNLMVKGSSDNKDAILVWDAPEAGVNGGVVVDGEVRYRVYSYNPADKTFALIADNVEGNTYTIELERTGSQRLDYYGVAPFTAEGTGQTVVGSVVLGPLYQLPYKESFADARTETSPWQVETVYSYGYTWGVDNPDGTRNNAKPQDGDGGCAYMFNGSMYEQYAGAGFISPKVALDANDNVLSFWVYNIATAWVYNIATAYPDNRPSLYVYLRGDDGESIEAAKYIVGGDTEEGWKKYEIPLSQLKGCSHMSFALFGYTGGGSDVIYLDNIRIEKADPTGVGGVTEQAKTVQGVRWFTTDGREVTSPGKGVYIMTETYTDGTRRSVKVTRR